MMTLTLCKHIFCVFNFYIGYPILQIVLLLLFIIKYPCMFYSTTHTPHTHPTSTPYTHIHTTHTYTHHTHTYPTFPPNTHTLHTPHPHTYPTPHTHTPHPHTTPHSHTPHTTTALLSSVNAFSVKLATKIQGIFTIIKLFALVTIILTGLIVIMQGM